MPGFFEKLFENKNCGRLMTAWIIEGDAAGRRALFSWQDKSWNLIYMDENFPGELAAAVKKFSPGETGILQENDCRVFVEPLFMDKKLIVCGAGHVAQCVIRLGVMLGFQVTVIEDRPEYAKLAEEAGAHRVFCEPFSSALSRIRGDAASAFVIMTREHVHDVECLRLILGKDYAYAGMMGSHSRCANIRRQLLTENMDRRKVEQVHMPIGLAIGARTPEEIAVSVMAQIVQIMNEQNAGEGFARGMEEELADCERAGRQAGILAMIIEKDGEAPRRPGTKMLIRKDGTCLGTVGGGLAEAKIIQAAGAMLEEGCKKSRVIDIDMKKGTMECGGRIKVFMLPL